MASVQSGYHSLFFSVCPRTNNTHSFKTGNILSNLLSGNSSHSDYPSCNRYLLARDFKSENGMKWDELKRDVASEGILSGRVRSRIASNAHMAETQIKTISFPSLDKFMYNSRI